MKRATTLLFLILLVSALAMGQREKPADAVELSQVTKRGKMLAEHDVAAWHSTDAVMALTPKEGSVTGYVAKKADNGWIVVYGRLSDKKDKYLIAFEATQQSSANEFKVQAFAKPKEDTGFFLNAAKALEISKTAFVPVEDRPYNAAVIPGEEGRFLVYFVPAQTEIGIFPLGGDTRFTVSSDGTKIIETRKLHKSIIEFKVPEGVKPESGYHTAILDDIPEDTDVFHVLIREPKVPELVVTQKFVYQIQTDGMIRYLMSTEAFKKVGKK